MATTYSTICRMVKLNAMYLTGFAMVNTSTNVMCQLKFSISILYHFEYTRISAGVEMFYPQDIQKYKVLLQHGKAFHLCFNIFYYI